MSYSLVSNLTILFLGQTICCWQPRYSNATKASGCKPTHCSSSKSSSMDIVAKFADMAIHRNRKSVRGWPISKASLKCCYLGMPECLLRSPRSWMPIPIPHPLCSLFCHQQPMVHSDRFFLQPRLLLLFHRTLSRTLPWSLHRHTTQLLC